MSLRLGGVWSQRLAAYHVDILLVVRRHTLDSKLLFPFFKGCVVVKPLDELPDFLPIVTDHIHIFEQTETDLGESVHQLLALTGFLIHIFSPQLQNIHYWDLKERKLASVAACQSHLSESQRHF